MIHAVVWDIPIGQAASVLRNSYSVDNAQIQASVGTAIILVFNTSSVDVSNFIRDDQYYLFMEDCINHSSVDSTEIDSVEDVSMHCDNTKVLSDII